MKVLVTGAAGFIGGHVAREAAVHGCEVAGIGGSPLSPEETAANGLVWNCPGPITVEALARVPFRPDLVIHCAGGASVGASVSDPDGERRKTVDCTGRVIAYLLEKNAEARLVYLSSGAVYGAAAAVLPRDMSWPATPLSPYGHHKAEAEDMVRSAASVHGLRAAIVRLFSIYGPGLRKQIFWDACRRFVTGKAEFSGKGSERRDFLAVSDAVKLLWIAGEKAHSTCPVVDGGTGHGTQVNALLSSLARHFEPRPELRFLNTDRAGDPIDMIAEPGPAFAWNWRPTISLEEGIAVYAAWFQKSQREA